MSGFNIVMFYGSVRPGRLGIRLVNFIRKKLEDGGHKVEIFDAQEMKLPLVEVPLHWYKDPAQAPEILKSKVKLLEAADGFILINGEYNRSIQPGLTNLLDHFSPKAYAYRPCAVASYSMGSLAGCISTSHLRDVMAELNMAALPKAFSVKEIHKNFNENGETSNNDMHSRCDSMLKDFLWYCGAIKSRKASELPPA